MTINPPETWRPIPSLPGYEASNLGRVRAPERIRPDRRGRNLRFPGGIYEGSRERNGRSKIYVGGGKYRKVAALVCEAFHGPRPSPGHECMHLDEDCSNDRAENVAWGTKQENQSSPRLRVRKSERVRGERHPNAKLSDAQVMEIRSLRLRGESLKTVAEKYCVTWKYVSQLCNGASRQREATK